MRIIALACAAAVLGVSAGAAAPSDPARPAANPAVKALVRGVNDQSRVRDLDVRKLDLKVRLRGGLA